MAIGYGRSNKLSAAGGNQFNDPRENQPLRNARVYIAISTDRHC